MLSFGLEEAKNVLPSWPIFSAGISVAAALVLSIYLLSEHLCAYNQPEEQKFLIGLIVMVPVYAVESYISLLNSNAAFICEMMRDCYEAFAMYCFARYLIACLGGEEGTIMFMEDQIDVEYPLLEVDYDYGVVKHPFPLSCFLRSWYLGHDFYNAVKIGIVQYMMVKPLCAFFAIFLELFGVYGEGKFSWTNGYPYLAVVLNFSQSWALYCLVQFYQVAKERLAFIKPLPKFLTFKSIVFLTWWQGVAVAFLFSTGILRSQLAQQLQTRIQDYIICIEMGIAAIVHLKVFPAKPYIRGERCVRNAAVMSDYASLGAPLDPEEARDVRRLTRMSSACSDDVERRLSFPQSVCDVVLGSSEIMIDDMRYTYAHVAEPVERGFSVINDTLHQISENVKHLQHQRKKSKDDSYLIPLQPWAEEFSDVHARIAEGSVSDSGLSNRRRRLKGSSQKSGSKKSFFRLKPRRWFN